MTSDLLPSPPMKSFEKLVKMEILKQIEGQTDHLQFAYQTGRAVENATLTLLNLLASHLEAPKTHAKLLFIDFSSASNTIQTYLMAETVIVKA